MGQKPSEYRELLAAASWRNLLFLLLPSSSILRLVIRQLYTSPKFKFDEAEDEGSLHVS